MIKPNMFVMVEDNTNFCLDIVQKGDIVFDGGTDSHTRCQLVSNYKNSKNKQVIGVCLYDVVNKDLTRDYLNFYNDEVQCGAKVKILKRGNIELRLPQYWRLPRNQSLYADEKGKPTWKNTGRYIGMTTSKQDRDGFVRIEIEIK